MDAVAAWRSDFLYAGSIRASSTECAPDLPRFRGGWKGLFAVKEFKEGGAPRGPHGGRLLTAEEVEALYPGNTLAPYVERVSTNAYRDAA